MNGSIQVAFHPIIAGVIDQLLQPADQPVAFDLAEFHAQNGFSQRRAQIAHKTAQFAVRVVNIFNTSAGLLKQYKQNFMRRLGVPSIQEFHGGFLHFAQLIRQSAHMPVRFRHSHAIQAVGDAENTAAIDFDIHFFPALLFGFRRDSCYGFDPIIQVGLFLDHFG